MALPTVNPGYPQDGATDVPLDSQLTFIVADLDTNIDLANTTVAVAYQQSDGTWVSQNVYAAGAFAAAWNANSSTAVYSGVLGDGYTFKCARSFGTPAVIGAWFGGNNTLHRITVNTQDLDAPPDVGSLVWTATTVATFYPATLEQLHRNLLRATFSNQLADTSVAENNLSPSALSLWSYSEYSYVRRQAERLGLLGVPGAVFKSINSATIRAITGGGYLYPNQLLIHTTALTEGESYLILPGSFDPLVYYESPTTWVASATDLTDVYGQILGNGEDFLFPVALPIHQTKTDNMRKAFRAASYDMGINANVGSIVDVVGSLIDELGGSGTSRSVTYEPDGG